MRNCITISRIRSVSSLSSSGRIVSPAFASTPKHHFWASAGQKRAVKGLHHGAQRRLASRWYACRQPRIGGPGRGAQSMVRHDDPDGWYPVSSQSPKIWTWNMPERLGDAAMQGGRIFHPILHQAYFRPNEQRMIRSQKPERAAVQQPQARCPWNNWFGG